MIFPHCRTGAFKSALSRLAPPGAVVLALCISACFDSGASRESRDDDGAGAGDAILEPSLETLASEMASSLAEEEALSLADELRVRPGELALFDYWDALRAANQPMQHLGKLPVTSIALPDGASCALADVLSRGGDWAALIDEVDRALGYTLTWSHWEHVTFDPQSDPPRSIVEAEFHFNSGSRRTRAIMKAELTADWSASGPSAPGEPPFTDVAMRVTDIAEGQNPAFRQLQKVAIESTVADTLTSVLAAPILVRDLNADHYPEVILLGSNTLLWNQANCTFVSQPLVPEAGVSIDANPGGFRAGTFGEFTGDGRIDLMLIDLDGRMYLLAGAPAGAFGGELIPVTTAPAAANASKLAAADIDGDGDTDLYIAQDKPLFAAGQMPSPTDNAASGNPGHMLRNDGMLHFTDITDDCGLREKRLRRVRDAAFHDYGNDGDPDLFFANAYAPIDIFENRDALFSDVSDTALSGSREPLMANGIRFADLNGDGIRDLTVTAVESRAGARIEAMRNAPESIGIAASSSRLLINRPRETEASHSVLNAVSARAYQEAGHFPGAGWANDSAALDYDNDGDLDVYLVNGNISGASTRDFDLYFWQRELRAATAVEDPVIALLFTDRFRPEPFQGLNQGRISWQGHQVNRFYRNDGAARAPAFHETGFLDGAALIDDCRAVEACDLDLDGKVDLLVVTESWHSVNGTLLPRQSLTVLRNENTAAQNWIGFQFDNVPPQISLAGTTVTLEFGKERRTLALADGASTLHLGLGKAKAPGRVEVRWPDGAIHYIEAPSAGRYLRVQFALD